MQQLTTQDEADAAFAEAVALLYKHSTRCPISLMAQQEVERFRAAHPEVPVYVVDVVLRRPLARHLAERTGVVHHSPQAILLRGGEAAWDASHLGITADALERELAALTPPGGPPPPPPPGAPALPRPGSAAAEPRGPGRAP